MREQYNSYYFDIKFTLISLRYYIKLSCVIYNK